MTNKEELQTGLPIEGLAVEDTKDMPILSEEEIIKRKEEEALAEKARLEEVEKQARKEMMAEIKAELMAELATEHEQKVALAQEERQRNAKERAEYVAKMKASSEPWVDWEGTVSDEHGTGIALDWNDAYVDFLRANGVTGVDDDAIVHKYVTILLRQAADTIDEEFEDKSKYEG